MGKSRQVHQGQTGHYQYCTIVTCSKFLIRCKNSIIPYTKQIVVCFPTKQCYRDFCKEKVAILSKNLCKKMAFYIPSG